MSQKNKREYESRALRLNDQKPTARDRWIAFHRLWRMVKKQSEYHVCDAQIACYILCREEVGRWIHLVEDSVDQGRKHWPLFIRRERLEIDRKQRLRKLLQDKNKVARLLKAILEEVRDDDTCSASR